MSVERREDAVWLRAYMDAFWVLMLISLSAIPLALTLRKVKLGGPVSVH